MIHSRPLNKPRRHGWALVRAYLPTKLDDGTWIWPGRLYLTRVIAGERQRRRAD